MNIPNVLVAGLLLCAFQFACGTAAPNVTKEDAAAPIDMAVIVDLDTADLAPAPYCGPVTLTGNATCDDCLATACCTVLGSCLGDGGCTNEWDHSAVVECEENACAAACDQPLAHCGGIQAQPQSCADCVYMNCCDQAIACAMNDACLALIYQCLDRDSAAEDACEQRYPGGADGFETLNDCGLDNCPGCF